jgi:cyanophycin synthetase
MAREKVSARLDPNRAPFEAMRRAFYAQLWDHAAEAIGARVERLEDEYLRVRRGERATFVRRSFVMLDSRLALDIAGHKPLSLRLLAEVGAPGPRHLAFDVADWRRAEGFRRELGRPAVVKPAVGSSAGRGITTGVSSPRALRRAVVRAAAYDRKLLVEEQIPGDSFRLFYLDGDLLDAVRRGPCTVIGDGRRTIDELVKAETKARLTARPFTSMHPLGVDLELRTCLREEGLGLRDVPGAGEPVRVKRVVNQNASRDNHSIRDEVHPDTVAVGARAARALGVRLAGVDLLTTDVSRPLSETGGVVSEVNTTPALHHHYLVANPERAAPVASLLLDRLLSD